MTENELDAALVAPLPEIADAGFSQRVFVSVMAEKARRERNCVFAVSGVIAVLCALMPFTRFGAAVDDWTISVSHDLSAVADKAMSSGFEAYGLSVPLAMTAGALALVLAVMQVLPSRR